MSAAYPGKECPHCDGTKIEPRTTSTQCTFCKGDGIVSHFKRASYFVTHPEKEDKKP